MFLHTAFPAGGAERITIDIANYIKDFGYKTYVIAHKSQNDFGEIYPQLVEIPGSDAVTTPANTKFIIEQINRLDIDILVISAISIHTIAEIRNNTRCKIVQALHSTPFWEGTSKLYTKKKLARGHFFQELKWWLITAPREKIFHKYEKDAMKSYRFIYNNADAYVFLCEEYKRLFEQKLHIQDGEQKLFVIHNSEQKPGNVNLDKKKEIIFAGRLSYEDKRVDRLIDIWELAYKKLPEWTLRIVGNGEELENLKEMAKRYRLKRIVFEGFHKNMKPFYDSASIICLTSQFEGWPLCITEAQANGVVPIAFACTAGVERLIAPSGTNGILIPPFNKHKFANELVALALDETRLRLMRDHVMEKAKSYLPDVTGKKWIELFERLDGKRG